MTWFVGRPNAFELGIKEHVHTLEYESLVRAFYGEHAFHAVDVAAFNAQEFADPIVESLAIEIAWHADPDRRDFVVVSMRDMVVLLPIRLHGVAIYMDVQRVLSAGFVNEIVAGFGNGERIFPVTFIEQESIERRPGDHRVTFLQTSFPIAKHSDGSFRRG